MRISIRRSPIVVTMALGALAAGVAGFAAPRKTAGPTPADGTPLDVTLTAHEGWFEIAYTASDSSRRAITANELHLPVGRLIRVTVKSDAALKLSVPDFGAGQQLVPGRTGTMWLRPLRLGTFDAHAGDDGRTPPMHLAIITHTPLDFETWLDSAHAPAVMPEDAVALFGQQVFTASCAACHRVDGTDAQGRVGPDLTHIASRLELGAGATANTTGRLTRWILEPASFKPGTRMPATDLTPERLQALIGYLQTLK